MLKHPTLSTSNDTVTRQELYHNHVIIQWSSHEKQGKTCLQRRKSLLKTIKPFLLCSTKTGGYFPSGMRDSNLKPY